MKRSVLVCLLFSLACASAPSFDDNESAALVHRFVAAFNAHDVEAMLALATDDVEWININGSTAGTETSGKEPLRRSMTSYFRNCPSCRSEVVVQGVNGPFVSAVERASYERNGQRHSASSTSIYEVRDGRIRRVWYFPAVK